MLQLQKYTWLIDTIRKAGKISLEEISGRWERNKFPAGGSAIKTLAITSR